MKAFPSHRNIKTLLTYLLIAIVAYSIAGAMLKVLEARSLGSIFRSLLPTTPFLLLIVLINMYDIRRLSFSSFIPDLPSHLSARAILKGFVPILILGILAGFITIHYFIEGAGGILITSITIYLFISLLLSCFYILGEERKYGVMLFIAAIPFLYFVQNRLHEIGLPRFVICKLAIPLSAIYLLITSIFFFTGRYRGIHSKISNDKKIIKICILFVLMPVFSVIFSADSLHSLLYYSMDILLPLLFFIIVMRSLKDIEDVNKFILVLIVSTFLYEFFALYFMYRGGSVADITINVYGSEVFTGHSAVLYPLIIPLQIAMYNLFRGWKQWAIMFMIITSLIYLFLSNYRTAILAALIGFSIFFYFFYHITFGRKLLITVVMTLAITALALYYSIIFEKLGFFRIIETMQKLSSGDPVAGLLSGRAEIWRAASAMIYDHPFFGIGPDMWNHYIPQYSIPVTWYKDYMGIWRVTYGTDPHNLYMLIWLNYGIANFICYLTILYIAVKKGLRNIKQSSSNLTRNTSVATFISLILWIVTSFFTMRFYNKIHLLYAVIFWSIIAIILKLSEFNSTHKASSA